MDTLVRLSKCPYKGCSRCLCCLCIYYFKHQVIKMNGELVCYEHFIENSIRVRELRKQN